MPLHSMLLSPELPASFSPIERQRRTRAKKQVDRNAFKDISNATSTPEKVTKAPAAKECHVAPEERDAAAWSQSSTMSLEGPDADIDDDVVREQLEALRSVASTQLTLEEQLRQLRAAALGSPAAAVDPPISWAMRQVDSKLKEMRQGVVERGALAVERGALAVEPAAPADGGGLWLAPAYSKAEEEELWAHWEGRVCQAASPSVSSIGSSEAHEASDEIWAYWETEQAAQRAAAPADVSPLPPAPPVHAASSLRLAAVLMGCVMLGGVLAAAIPRARSALVPAEVHAIDGGLGSPSDAVLLTAATVPHAAVAAHVAPPLGRLWQRLLPKLRRWLRSLCKGSEHSNGVAYSFPIIIA